MKILTLENKTFHLNNLPEQLDDDVRFAVLDNSNAKEPDFFFIPLIFFGQGLRRRFYSVSTLSGWSRWYGSRSAKICFAPFSFWPVTWPICLMPMRLIPGLPSTGMVGCCFYFFVPWRPSRWP